MAISIKSLADGQLPLAKTTLYTVPASTTAIIRLITLVNTGAAARTVNLYLKPSGGTSRRLIPQNMSIAVGNLANVDQIMTLEAGDVIEGDASVAAEVDYTIGGVEKTAGVANGQFNISAGTTSNNMLAVTFSNLNGVSFGLNGSTITASVQTNYAGIGFTSTTTAGTEVKATLSTNGLSMAVPAYLTTGGGGGGVTISSYQNAQPNQSMTWSNSTSHAVAFQLPQNASFSFLRGFALFTNASTGLSTLAASADMSAVRQYTFRGVIYSLGTGASSQSLMSVTSGSCAFAVLNSASIAANGTQGSYTQQVTWHLEGSSSSASTQYSASAVLYPFSSNLFTGVTNNRLLDLDLAASLTPGPYWLVIGMSSTTDANSARISGATTAGGYYLHHYAASQLNQVFRRFDDSAIPAYIGGGLFSTAGGGTVAAIHLTNFSTTASNLQFVFQLLRSA